MSHQSIIALLIWVILILWRYCIVFFFSTASVYLEQLPQASSLPPIHQACIAKPLPAPIPIPNDPSLFQYLLPLEIATAVRSFRKSAAIELSNVEAIVTNSDTNCSSCLKVMGLPASLETEQEGSEKGISDATWARSVGTLYASCFDWHLL